MIFHLLIDFLHVHPVTKVTALHVILSTHALWVGVYSYLTVWYWYPLIAKVTANGGPLLTNEMLKSSYKT